MSFVSLLSFVYRCGLAAENIGKAIVWVLKGLWSILSYIKDLLWPQKKQIAIAFAVLGAFAAFIHFVVEPTQLWLEDRAMMKNPIIAHVGEDFLIDGRKVIKFQEIGRISLSDWSGGGASIDTMYPNDQVGVLVVCANSAFQNDCFRLPLEGTLNLIDFDSPQKGPYGVITYSLDKKSGNTFILIKTFRAMNTLPPPPQ